MLLYTTYYRRYSTMDDLTEISSAISSFVSPCHTDPLALTASMTTPPSPYLHPIWRRSGSRPATEPHRRPNRAQSSLVTARQLKPECESQCPDETYSNITESDTISDNDKPSQQQLQSVDDAEPLALQRKSKPQLENDAEAKQKQINKVFMNLKIAEKVNCSRERDIDHNTLQHCSLEIQLVLVTSSNSSP